MVPCTDYSRGEEVLELVSSSKIVSALVGLKQTPAFVRVLSSVTRERDTVRVGNWVILQQARAKPYAGLVDEIMECGTTFAGVGYIRIWCSKLREVHEDPDGTRWAFAVHTNSETIVYFECVRVDVVVRSVAPDASKELFR